MLLSHCSESNRLCQGLVDVARKDGGLLELWLRPPSLFPGKCEGGGMVNWKGKGRGTVGGLG